MRCFLAIHQWSKWQELRRGKIRHRNTLASIPVSDWRTTGYFIDQVRICDRCGKAEIRTVSVDMTDAE